MLDDNAKTYTVMSDRRKEMLKMRGSKDKQYVVKSGSFLLETCNIKYDTKTI